MAFFECRFGYFVHPILDRIWGEARPKNPNRTQDSTLDDAGPLMTIKMAHNSDATIDDADHPGLLRLQHGRDKGSAFHQHIHHLRPLYIKEKNKSNLCVSFAVRSDRKDLLT